MFLKKSSYEDFSAELESNLKKAEREPIVQKIANESKAITCLIKAANLLDEIGLESQANVVTKLLEKISWNVPELDTSDLTSEKMIENIKNKGWVFNADDGEILEVVEPEADEHVELQPDGDIEVTM